ncbi:hypothetical protein KSB_53760 [Ktedonobacter robiniae]|uniref:Uncharacterized protein n=1 Tax=Ktedonobacter robiniae TaxID=2778365 RepID=A0ABQ3UVN1_9CHLR|nr:hypothetical protein KSB_53760 [Ktedonobacter robiniae]
MYMLAQAQAAIAFNDGASCEAVAEQEGDSMGHILGLAYASNSRRGG